MASLVCQWQSLGRNEAMASLVCQWQSLGRNEAMASLVCQWQSLGRNEAMAPLACQWQSLGRNEAIASLVCQWQSKMERQDRPIAINYRTWIPLSPEPRKPSRAHFREPKVRRRGFSSSRMERQDRPIAIDSRTWIPLSPEPRKPSPAHFREVLLKHVLWTVRWGGLFRYRTLGESPVVAGGLFQLWPLLKHALWIFRGVPKP